MTRIVSYCLALSLLAISNSGLAQKSKPTKLPLKKKPGAAVSQTKPAASRSVSDPAANSKPPEASPAPGSAITANEEAPKVTRKKPATNPNRVMVITYGNTQWNKKATKIENATLILKDAKSSRMVQISLDETEPDSSSFSGSFSISWAEAAEIIPEVYIPPQDLIGSEKGFVILRQMIEEGKLKRKPFMLSKGERGEQRIDVFDSKEQVESAIEVHKKGQELKVAQSAKIPKAAIADDSAAKALLEADQLAKVQAEKRKQEEEALKREQDRLRMEQIEKQKAEERKRQQEQLAVAEREKRKKEAVQFAEAAMDLFRLGNFAAAESNFAKSVDLDPSNHRYYYAYGVTLFKNNKFNESIVVLKNAEGTDFDPIERDFYVALAHYRLKEYDTAKKEFDDVRKTKHKVMAPSASFYMGLVDFDTMKYEEAKVFFQEVIDTSEDPRLDEKADEYMEKCDRVLEFARNKAKEFLLDATVGLQQDSNILLTSNSTLDSSPPSAVGGLRYIGGAGLQWRPFFEKSYEFGFKGSVNTMYTSNATLAKADPLSYAFTTPYVYKGAAWGKGFKFDFKPGYEILYLDANADGTKENYMTSTTADINGTFVMNEDWFSGYGLKWRQDLVPSATTNNAMKVTLVFNNIFFFDKKKTQGAIGDFQITQNNAEGADLKFTRFDIGGTYLFPAFWEMQGTAGLTYYNANYSQSSTGRKDSNITISSSLTRTLTDWLSMNINGSYIINTSSVDTNTYKKYTVGTLFSGNWQF